MLMRSVVITAAVVLAARAGAQSADPRSSLLVTGEWLASRLSDANLVLLHVGTRAEYDAQHLPGARYLDPNVLARTTAATAGIPELTLEMPTADSLRSALASLGVSDGSRVVVYYGNDRVPQTTRIVATLDYAGLDAMLLDGGMRKWVTEGRVVTKDVPPPKTGTLAPLKLRPTIVNAQGVQARMLRSSAPLRLVDARLVNFFSGADSAGPRDARRSGHLPAATNIPFSSLFNERYEWLAPEALAAAFAKAGVQKGDTVVAYCHIGQQATAVVFAARTLGIPVLLYDGSFEDWARRGLPVVK
jgi:thiosulfate/3-mercaptopyruvate sulfurtransferase